MFSISKLRKEFIIKYLDLWLPGEIACVKIKGKRYFPPERIIQAIIKRKPDEDIEHLYQRGQDEIIRQENEIYNELKSKPGKGYLFIRDQRVEPYEDGFIFTNIIYVDKILNYAYNR